MTKGLKRLIIILIAVITVAAVIFVTVFLLAKQKKICNYSEQQKNCIPTQKKF